MSIVIDASATVAWFLPDEFDDAANALLTHVARKGAIVPSLWVVEIENALRNAHRRRRVTEDEVSAILARLAGLPIRVVDAHETPVFYHAFSLSVEYNISVYDGVYVDAARRHGAALASRDKRLLEVASQLGVPTVTNANDAIFSQQ